MQTPLELSFQNLEPSETIEARVRERVERLERFFGRATSCHVHIEAPHRHQRRGILYEVRIEVRIPGKELVVNNRPGDVNAHRDIYVAIRDAFDAMERQMKKWHQRMDGEVKAHETPTQGRIVEIHPDQDYGQIATSDGRLIYFHRNAVVAGKFDDLSEGDTVELVVQYGDAEGGPHASTVRPIAPIRYVDKP